MKRRVIEAAISVGVVGFWFTLTILGIRNQFNVPSLPSEQFQTFLNQENPIIIDLRESLELNREPLNYNPLIHLPFSFVENHLNWINIPQNGTILFICSDGNRARLITSLMKKRGINGYYLRSGLHYVRTREAQGSRLKAQKH